MAVVPRKRRSGKIVYYVVVTWQGKPVWERIGPSKREAESRERIAKKQVADGTYQPQVGTRALTVRQWSTSWFATRSVRSLKDEKRWVNLHVLTKPHFADKPIAEWEMEHTDQLVRELKAEGKLVDKSIANILGVLSPMFKAAERGKFIAKNPITVERKDLKRTRQSEPEIYTAAEVRVLTRHLDIPWPFRVLNALVLYLGEREGEACGRRWRDLYTDSKPLWALHVHSQYDDRPLKTERPRMAPVHPELAEILEAWGREGFELLTGRKPTPDDFIVPNVGKRAKKRNHTRSTFYKGFIKSCLTVDIRPRTLHATRNTFTTLARRGGAHKDVLEKITHNGKGDIIDRYTQWEWDPLCAAVLCLNLDVHQTLSEPPGKGGKSTGSPRWLGKSKSTEVPNSAIAVQGSIPGASTPKQLKTSLPENARQKPRQRNPRNDRVVDRTTGALDAGGFRLLSWLWFHRSGPPSGSVERSAT